jgi:Zn-dependent peptidase ImmA (M78 family)/DNA-binding XRE family transcriptional regulator
MARRSPEVDVKPEVLKWARESSGWTIGEIARKLKVSPESYRQWETTGSGVKVTHLEALAHHFKRPLAAFFLPRPPVEPKPPRDFRSLPGRRDKFEKKTLFAIRQALWLQTIAGELSEAIGLETNPQVGKVELTDSPEMASVQARQFLGVSLDEQIRWRDESKALQRWRDAAEKTNVFVFSLPMPLDDARGFSLTERNPWIIVLNSSDAIRARIFTLFHEYGHLLLRNPGVCLPHQGWVRDAKLEGEELWCNQFAASLLLPAQAIREVNNRQRMASEQLPQLLWESSRRFKVSQEVVLRRLLSLRLISQAQFWQELDRLRTIPARERRGGFAAPPMVSVRTNGGLLTRLVLEGRERELITYSDVARFLGVRLKHLGKIESLVAT